MGTTSLRVKPGICLYQGFTSVPNEQKEVSLNALEMGLMKRNCNPAAILSLIGQDKKICDAFANFLLQELGKKQNTFLVEMDIAEHFCRHLIRSSFAEIEQAALDYKHQIAGNQGELSRIRSVDTPCFVHNNFCRCQF
jgi:hypothetical protein